MKKNNFKRIAELVARVKLQDADAFVELYNCMYHKVYFLALSIVKDEYLAQDVVQETFINVYKSINTLDNNLMFIAWINRISYHCSLKLIAKNEEMLLNGEAMDEEEDASEKSEPLETVLSKEKSQTIVNSILELSPEYKTVMILKYYEGLKLEEIADCLECSVGTVKSRLNRGRKALKKHLSIRGRLLTMFLFGSFTITFSISGYARAHAMPASMAEGALAAGKGALGISSAAGFCESAGTVLSLMTVKGMAAGAFALALISGVVYSNIKPDISISYQTVFTNQAIPVSIKVDSVLPVRTVQFTEDGEHWLSCKNVIDGVYQVRADKNGRYSVRATLQNGREAKQSFEITAIDTGLPELYSYEWNEETNTLHCLIRDDLSGIDYSRIYKLAADGSRQLPVYFHESKGEIGFSLSAAPFFVYLYDKSGNFAKYKIEPYPIKAH